MVVGAGAGGSVLTQRLARAGWSVVCLDAGPFWDPDTDWVSDERGSHTPVLDRAAADRRRATRCRWGPTTPAAASAAPWSTTPGTPPGSTPPTSAPAAATASARTGRSDYPDLQAVLRADSKPNCRSPGRTGRGATRTATRTARTRSAATARCSCAARTPPASTARVGPVAIPNGRFGNRPHCIYRGFCLQGCKVNAKASPLITHIPDALAHGAEIRPDSHVSRVARRRPHRPGHRRHLPAARRCEHRQRARAVAVAGYSIETPRLLLLSATRPLSRRAGQRPRPGRPAT